MSQSTKLTLPKALGTIPTNSVVEPLQFKDSLYHNTSVETFASYCEIVLNLIRNKKKLF